ncbi:MULTISPECIES: RicAFT regulatory complex protein RicA family protein [Paenibacillus]|uniref:YlbF family regulator n=1 Tax=Paenibacillus violae TaxID=3077234 RepID=A0ABU3RAG2_9BACL|nr:MULTISPECIES: YlbF family regulator [Paenibacillus]MDU0201272.1 YlbF family regulator [Paenibacillus sp. PFR10]MEC0265184.1 YlbF family regulator [Paenibacillus anseongense]
MRVSQCDHQHDNQPHAFKVEEFTNTEMIVREDILDKAKELANLLTTSNEVQFYQKAEKQIATNPDIQVLISSIKKKQKEIVAFQTFKNEKMVQKIENEIEVLQDELDGIPIVSEFKQTQDDINYLLQLVMSVIRDTISDKINVEAGTSEAPTSCD